MMAIDSANRNHIFRVTLTGRFMNQSRIVFLFDDKDVLLRPADAEFCAILLVECRDSPRKWASNLQVVAGSRDNVNTLITRNRAAIDAAFGRGTGRKTIRCVYPKLFT